MHDYIHRKHPLVRDFGCVHASCPPHTSYLGAAIALVVKTIVVLDPWHVHVTARQASITSPRLCARCVWRRSYRTGRVWSGDWCGWCHGPTSLTALARLTALTAPPCHFGHRRPSVDSLPLRPPTLHELWWALVSDSASAASAMAWSRPLVRAGVRTARTSTATREIARLAWSCSTICFL